MTTVATNSYHMMKDLIKFGEMTSDDIKPWIKFALHDYSARGVAPGAQTANCGAHLAISLGSDTLEAICYMANRYGVKEGLPGYSVLATEHSVMSSEGRDGEYRVAKRCIEKAIAMGPGNILSMVNDTYDMQVHVIWVSENMKEVIEAGKLRWVTRPDSGNPPEVVVWCLHTLDKYWGSTVNSKGYKVLNPCVRVIQGDGIDGEMLVKVLEAVVAAGFSTENVVFGSGAGLCQKINRDDLRFSMKASYLEVNGEGRDVFKQPITQTGNYNKASKKGLVSLYRKNGTGEYVTLTPDQLQGKEGWVTEILVPIYKNGVILREYTLDEVRANTGLW